MEPGEVIAGRYEVERLCATGGMGVVYRAVDTRAGAPVAVKVLRSTASATELERFGREADLLASFAHPGIVRAIDRGLTAIGESYIVQEWIEGVTLRERMRAEPLTVADAIAVARGVAAALAEPHARGVIHRDIKPSNIMLAGGSPTAVKVLDFGIARMARGPLRRLTRTGAVVGTVNYMAPEQARGDLDVDARADVFAIGAVLYECVAGREAFRGRTPIATRAKILLLEPEPLAAELPAALVALLTRLLAKRRDDRPADGAAVVAALAAIGPVPAQLVASPTRVRDADPSDQFTCIAMSAPAAALLGRTVDELRDEVSGVSASFGCVGAVMDDGSALVVAPGSGPPELRAAAAIRAALLLKRRWDVVPIAVAGGVAPTRVEHSIDDRATALETAALTTVFGELADEVAPFAAGVMIEPEVAALVGDDFEITNDAGALRVVAERRTPTG